MDPERRESASNTAPPLWKHKGDSIVLLGRRCKSCGKRSFTRLQYCDVCHATEFDQCELPREGVLYSFSEIHVGPRRFSPPYIVGYVDIGPDIRVFSQIEGNMQDLQIGMPMIATSGPIAQDEDGTAIVGYKFRPEVRRDV